MMIKPQGVHIPLDPFGPVYPSLPGANKWRRLSRMRILTSGETAEYGEAVLEGIRVLQRQELARATPERRSNSASGTFLSDGHAILAAIRTKIGTSDYSKINPIRDAWIKFHAQPANPVKRPTIRIVATSNGLTAAQKAWATRLAKGDTGSDAARKAWATRRASGKSA